MSLLTLMGKETFPTVKEILDTAEEAKEVGNFVQIKTKDNGVYYTVVNAIPDIELKPADFMVAKSIKYDGVLFIVPAKSQSTFNAKAFDA